LLAGRMKWEIRIRIRIGDCDGEKEAEENA
jgi:hypothetical protein